MPLQVLLAWWNLVFIVPFGLALFYLGLFVFTGITFGDADADMDADVDADADMTVHVEAEVAADVDADADVDGDADADHDAETPSAALAHAVHTPTGMLGSHSVDVHHAEGEGQTSAFAAFLSFLGVGKIPLSLALMTLLFCWGITGFALNALLYKWLGASAVIGLISLPVTLILALALTGLFAALIAKIIPNDDSTRQRRTDLVGKAGEAMYDINAEFGMATVRGTAGDFFQVPCRTAAGKPQIPKGARIVLFDYDREKGIFEAAPFEA